MLLAIVLLAGLLSIVQAVTGIQPSTVPIVVAAKELPAGTPLGTADIRIENVPEELVPEDSIRDIAEIEGEVLVTALPRGMPLPRSLILSADFLATAPPGQVIMPVTIIADGTEDLASSGVSVSLFAPPDEFSENIEAVLVTDSATVVGQGRVPEGDGFLSDSDNTRVLFLAVPEDRATLVLGYGTRTPMRIVLNSV
ncbi:SAF domain-containing protein [Actinomycetaceae bacterium L2_0104]